ncbi:MAG: AAA family ATPase [Desulfobacterales bacterium]|nr:AAA family ATPase [Desulfobacterales bacterium]
MYLPYYLLTAKPFQISADPRFLWLGNDHQEALANFKYGLSEGNGFVVLVGAVGTGKTTLVNALLEMLDERVIVASINQPGFDVVEFLSFVVHTYDPQAVVASKTDCLNFFKKFLEKAHADGKRVLLVIDEAHRLSEEVLEEIRLLSNLEQDGRKLINIFFVGQTELMHKLRTSACRALRQRITLFFHLRPLTAEETEKYILHRLRVAGCSRRLFSNHAMFAIHGYSRGYPRLINKLCDRALLTGYVQDRTQISAVMVRECAREMRRIDPFTGPLARLFGMFFGGWRWTWAEEWRQWPWVERCRRWPAAALDTLTKTWGGTQPAAAAQPFSLAAAPSLIGEWIRGAGASLLGKKRVLATAIAIAIIAWLVVDGWNTLRSNELDLEKAARIAGPAEAQPEKPSSLASLPSPPQAQSPDKAPQPSAAPAPQPESPRSLALGMMARGDHQGAVSLLGANGPSPEDRPVYAQALMGCANQLMESSPLEARGLLEKAAAADPDNAQAHLELGHLCTRSKQFTPAIEHYQAAIRLSPQSVEALYNLGFIYAANGAPAKAEEMFNRVVALKPDFLDKALFNLAVVQQKLGKRKESIASLEAAVAERPENEKAQAYLKALKAGARGTQ